MIKWSSSRKKIPGKNVFFCADLWSAKVFSMLIILIDHWQVLSYLISMPLLNQSNHAILQKSWSTRILLTVFPWILEPNASKEEKRACPFSSLTPRRQKTTTSFCKVWASKLADSNKDDCFAGKEEKKRKWQKSLVINNFSYIKDKVIIKPRSKTGMIPGYFLNMWKQRYKIYYFHSYF